LRLALGGRTWPTQRGVVRKARARAPRRARLIENRSIARAGPC